MIDPDIIQSKKDARTQAISRALAGMEEEHNNALARKAIIERRKELVETLLVRKEKEEQRERAIRKKQMDEELKQRQLEDARRREIERKRREIEAIHREEARKLAESLKAKNLKVQPEDLENLDTDSLVQLQVAQLEKEKRELNERLRATAKRMDHTERANRKEEISLLERDYERQKKADKAYHESARKLQLETTATKHAADLKVKDRLMRILPEYQKYRKEIESKRFEEFEQRRRAAQDKIEEEKEKRRQLYRTKKEEERKRKEAEEEARKRAEEDELRRKEAEERAEQERIAKAETEKALYEAKKRKLDEQAEKQREAERLAEEKLLQRERERERETEQRKIEERERERERIEKEREKRPVPATGGSYVHPWRRSTESTTTESSVRPGPWRRSGSGRATVPEDGSRRRDPEPEWRRTDSGREDTEKRKSDPSRRTTAEDMEWRRSDSGRGSTNEERAWRRTSASSREESGAKQESSWRRGVPPSSDRGDRSDSKWTKGREDSWRKDADDPDQTSPSSSRGSTRILKPEGSWRSRAGQSEQKLDDQDDQIFHDEPDEDESLVKSEDNLKPVSSGRQNVPIEPDDDGFIPVTKGKRRGRNQLGHGHDLE